MVHEQTYNYDQGFNQPQAHQQMFNQYPPEQNMVIETQPQNELITGGSPQGEDLDPEFLAEIETYLKECMENNELSIDMSDTLIKDHGAKMVAAAASLCD